MVHRIRLLRPVHHARSITLISHSHILPQRFKRARGGHLICVSRLDLLNFALLAAALQRRGIIGYGVVIVHVDVGGAGAAIAAGTLSNILANDL